MHLIRRNSAALAMFVVFLAVYHSISHAEAVAQASNKNLNADFKPTDASVSARFLRQDQQVAKDEERALSDFTSKIKSILRTKPTVKDLESNQAIKSLERSPTIKNLADNPSKEIQLTNENIKKLKYKLTNTPGLDRKIIDRVGTALKVLAGIGVVTIPVFALMIIFKWGKT